MKIKNLIDNKFNLKTTNINLRLLTESDKNLLLKWLTDERVLSYWEGKSSVFDLKRINKDFYSEEKGLIRIIIEYHNKPIGYLQTYPLDKESIKDYNYETNNKLIYGIDQFIGEPEYWGKGIGTSFMKLILSYLFNDMQADSVILDPHVDNLRAIRCYENAGFKIIKLLQRHELHDGKMVDCFLMECTKQLN